MPAYQGYHEMKAYMEALRQAGVAHEAMDFVRRTIARSEQIASAHGRNTVTPEDVATASEQIRAEMTVEARVQRTGSSDPSDDRAQS